MTQAAAPAVAPAVSAPLVWRTAGRVLRCERPLVMAIVNVTPDSFADGGAHFDPARAIARCEQALAEGADILDLGGESTRPGAAPVAADEELRRVRPVLRAAVRLGAAVSVDTRQPEVMQAALDEGADIVNDVFALQAPGALQVLARHPAAGVCLMHMKGDPRTMRDEAVYADVVAEVIAFLRGRLQAAGAQGIAAERIAVDPGYGFAKRPEHGWTLLSRQRELGVLARPLVVGLSRKGMVGGATGRAVGERRDASVAAALLAAQRGAHVLRVHDVAATVDALAILRRLQQADAATRAAPAC